MKKCQSVPTRIPYIVFIAFHACVHCQHIYHLISKTRSQEVKLNDSARLVEEHSHWPSNTSEIISSKKIQLASQDLPSGELCTTNFRVSLREERNDVQRQYGQRVQAEVRKDKWLCITKKYEQISSLLVWGKKLRKIRCLSSRKKRSPQLQRYGQGEAI